MIKFLVKSTRIPEVTATTLSVNGQDAMGVVRDQPVSIMFSSPLSMTIICDRNYVIYKEMRKWFNQLATNANPFERIGVTGDSQRMKYYQDYVKTISITKLEQNGLTETIDRTLENGYFSPFNVVFNNAFPVRIGDLVLSNDAYDQAMEFTVEFSYETYTIGDGNNITYRDD